MVRSAAAFLSVGLVPVKAQTAKTEGLGSLAPVNVTTSRYEPAPRPAVPRFMLRLGPPGFPSWELGWPVSGAFVLTAARSPQIPKNVAAAVRVLDGGSIQSTSAITLDSALRSLPAFGLMRRDDSLSGDAAAQRVALRGLGASGDGHSLVVFDGVPINEPFDGGISWAKIPREGLARAELVLGSGATAWGNAALGGVMQVFALPVKTEAVVIDEPPKPLGVATQGSARFAAMLGSFGTRSAEFAVTTPVGPEILQVLGRDFATDGFVAMAAERRGPIDVPAWGRHRWLQGRWRQALGKQLEFTTMVRSFEEFRGAGTPYTGSGAREKNVSFTLLGRPFDAFAWNAVAYAQDSSSANRFSVVNLTRTAEIPTSDRFALPAVAWGGAWTGQWSHAGGARTSGGIDVRELHAEARENISFTNGSFTQQRFAGGAESFAGAFLQHERLIAPTLRVVGGVRLDDWRATVGHRRETDLATHGVVRDDHYASREGTEYSPHAGVVWTPVSAWRVFMNLQRAFRVPTPSEFFSPSHEGETVIENNPGLRRERNIGESVGLEWKSGPSGANARPAPFTPRFDTLVVGAAAFRNDLHDAVDAIALAHRADMLSNLGGRSADGIGRQYLNLDHLRSQGFELSATWRPSEIFSLTAESLFNDSTIRRAAVAPQLVGKEVAHVPRHSASLGATWKMPGGVAVTSRLRWLGRQFDNDENTLRLNEAVVADLGISRWLTPHLELFLTAGNLGNARVETRRSAEGLVYTGTPRMYEVGVRGVW